MVTLQRCGQMYTMQNSSARHGPTRVHDKCHLATEGWVSGQAAIELKSVTGILK